MIDPEKIPQFTGNLAELEQAYGGLKTDASNIRDTGRDVHTQFQGLSAYYKAPEAEQLFATTKPVATRADTFATDLETVSSALSGYASEIRPLVEKLKQLKIEATAFVNSVKDDKDWEYDGDKVDHHNRIRDEITQTVAAFWAAERTCHNKITALWHGTQMVAGDGSDRKDQYGFNAADMKNAKLPWGDPVEEKHHWYEIGHWVKSFVWDGIVVDGIWGTIKGLGTLVGVNGWAAMGQAWKGLAQLATGLVISSIPGAATLFWTLPDDKLPSWLRDSRTAMKETGKALVAWDEWGKNPARAAGAVTFNVLTTVFTGGAGGAASGAGKAGAVARAISMAGKVGRVIDPMTYVGKAAGMGLSKIGDLTKALKGIGNVEIPKLPENAITLPEGAMKLPDGTVHLPEGAAIPEGAVKLPDGNFQLPHHEGPVLPEGTTKLPTPEGAPARYYTPGGHLLDEHGNVLQKAEDATKEPGGTELDPHSGSEVPHTPAPVKEPALVGAGTHGIEVADSGSHVGDNLGGSGHGGSTPGGGHADDLGTGSSGGHGLSHEGSHGDGGPSGGGHGDDATPPPHHGEGTESSAGHHSDDAAAGTESADNAANSHPGDPTHGDASAPTIDETPPKKPGDDEPLLIRQDDDFNATHNQFGLRKSRFDPDLGIVPAKPDGSITPLEHVLGGANPQAKEASQFTSFAPKDGTGKIYGQQEVSIDYRRLQADIDAGKVQNVEILRPEQIQSSIGEEINKVAGKEVEVPTTLKPTDNDAISEFIKNLGLSKSKASKVHRRVMALLNTRRDGEWLISGVIPKEYVTGPYPTTKMP